MNKRTFFILLILSILPSNLYYSFFGGVEKGGNLMLGFSFFASERNGGWMDGAYRFL